MHIDSTSNALYRTAGIVLAGKIWAFIRRFLPDSDMDAADTDHDSRPACTGTYYMYERAEQLRRMISSFIKY